MCDLNIQMEIKPEKAMKGRNFSFDCNKFQNFLSEENNEHMKKKSDATNVDGHESEFCPCPKECRMSMCSSFIKRKYIQPTRRESCKPIICYQKPSLPFANATIYKNSFKHVDPFTATCCRLPLIRPKSFLQCPNSNFEKDTVTQLSYPMYCAIEKRKPIVPSTYPLFGIGPMQELTTQKHDYNFKFQYRRMKILPKDNIKKLCGSIENETTHRLSFIPTGSIGKRESFKPISTYKKSEIPMEFETTQKLSFMPNNLPNREEFPWIKKPKYQPPSIAFARNTITKLSYLAPGCFV